MTQKEVWTNELREAAVKGIAVWGEFTMPGGRLTQELMEDVEILSRRYSRLAIEMKQELAREALSRKTEMWPGVKTMKIEGIKPLGEKT